MLRKSLFLKDKGFTLLELMIVVAIIGILAAILIPNFIHYRDKAYCSYAEDDAGKVADALASYFSIPSRLTLPSSTLELFRGTRGRGSLNSTTAGTISGSLNGSISIVITDTSGRCPDEYQQRVSGWDSVNNTYSKVLSL